MACARADIIMTYGRSGQKPRPQNYRQVQSTSVSAQSVLAMVTISLYDHKGEIGSEQSQCTIIKKKRFKITEYLG